VSQNHANMREERGGFKNAHRNYHLFSFLASCFAESAAPFCEDARNPPRTHGDFALSLRAYTLRNKKKIRSVQRALRSPAQAIKLHAGGYFEVRWPGQRPDESFII